MTVTSKTGKVCLHCRKPLQTIGRQRKNGVQRHGDWDARVLHKKCWQQLHGRKHIYLFPPSCWRDLYPFPVSETGMSWAFAQVRQSQPDLERFPRLAAALQQRIELILDEGEVSTAAAATT